MERAIWLAWRIFWVGLGASGVLVAQAVATPSSQPPVDNRAPVVVPAPESPASSPGVRARPRAVKAGEPELTGTESFDRDRPLG